MNKSVFVIISFIVMSLITAVDRNTAMGYSLVLNDDSPPSFGPVVSLSPGTYRFNLSYWVDARIGAEDFGGPSYFDIFAYGLLSGPDSSNPTSLPIMKSVDITGSILESNPTVVFEPFTVSPLEPFLFPVFFLSNIVADNTATVYIDYGMEQVIAPVPEPSTVFLLGGGLLGLYGFARRRKK